MSDVIDTVVFKDPEKIEYRVDGVRYTAAEWRLFQRQEVINAKLDLIMKHLGVEQ